MATIDPGIDVHIEVKTPILAVVPTQIDLRETAGPRAPGDRVIDLRAAPDDFATDPGLSTYATAHLVRSDADLLASRRLHAEIFLTRGFITADDIDSNGTIRTEVDPWSTACTYFSVIREGTAIATARQITAADPDRLPALALSGLIDHEVRRIREVPSGAAVEISGLSRRRGARSPDVVAVYVSMWQESLRRRHQVWVMAVDLQVFGLLQALMCGDAIRRIGPPQEYMGSMVVPAVIWCDELNPEQRRLSDLAGPGMSFRSLLPRLFPHPVGQLA